MKGEIYALLAALTWGAALVLFRLSGEKMRPVVLNLFKNVIAMILFFLTLLVMGEGGASLVKLSLWDWGSLCLSGFLGIAVADSLLFASLNRVGVTRISIIDCLYSPSVIFFSWAIISEKVGWSHLLGALLIVIGIVVTVERVPAATRVEIESRELWVGVVLGVLAIWTMAFGIVLAKPALEKVSLLWGATIRLVSGSVALALWLLLTRRDELKQLLRPQASWRYSIPGSILGSYFAMLFWVGGFKYTKASTAGLLNQSSIIFALILSAIFLNEPLTRRRFLSVCLAAGGVLVVTFRPLG